MRGVSLTTTHVSNSLRSILLHMILCVLHLLPDPSAFSIGYTWHGVLMVDLALRT